MKRTITMNLSGIVFHIEEDAYEKLNQYLQTIKSYFKDAEGCDEIMNDIESRIAEMLQGKVSNTKQAVIMADVQNVISVMGSPEEFAGDNASGKDSAEKQRNNNSSSYAHTGRRRIFRDPDNRIIGGVCSCIANYFDFDPIWLRAAFAISFFAFGTGFLLYFVLLIIIPKATTTAEKLEMRGEKVDVNNIGKAVNEEFQEFKKKMNDLGKEMQSPENKERIRSTAQKTGDFIKELLYRFFKIVGKAAAFILIFLGIVLTVALLATLFGRGTISVFDTPGNNIRFSLYELSAAILPADLPVQLLVTGLILFIGIPLLSMIYGGIRFLFGIKQKNRIVKYSANLLWLLGLGILVYVGIQLGSDFSEQASNRQTISVIQPKGNTLYLDLNVAPKNDEEVSYRHRHKIHFGGWTVVSKDENKFLLGYPTLDIIQSTSDNFELVAIKTANGFDKKEAAYRAKNIDYIITQTDSLIEFNSFFDISATDKLRAQDVRLLLKVPAGKSIFLSKRMEDIIFDIDNVNDALDSDMVNRKWMMTKRGLECVDCDGLENAGIPLPPAPPAKPE